MLHLLLTAAILVLPSQQPNSDQNRPPAPIQVSSTEAAVHSTNYDLLYLRVSQNQWSLFSSIEVTVVVDPSGTVISSCAQVASPDGNHSLSRSTIAEAESMVRALHFEPFERAGHPVVVTFARTVYLLPPELKPAQHVPFPGVKDWKTVKFTLARTGCFGTYPSYFGICPSYKVEIHGDGSVLYQGETHVAFTGYHRGFVPQSNVIELVKLFEQADYYSLRDEYTASVTHSPTYLTSIEIDGRRKQVVDYEGTAAGMPVSVEQLEDAIDRLSGSWRWTQGNFETMAALESEHWDFKSAEAADTLARAAMYGDAYVVRDLVEAGVPLNGGNERQGLSGAGGNSPLESAAFRGYVDMLRTLLLAGAGSNPAVLEFGLVNAAASGNVEALRLLLQNGAVITSRDESGRTVLIAAAASGSPEMVSEVLKNHADVNASTMGPLPLCTPELKKNDECPEFAGDDGQTALMAAVAGCDYVLPEGVNRLEVVRLLLAAGADVNARDKAGNTALILAADSAEQVELLLQAGADPGVRNLAGETALSKSYDNDVKQLLIRYGAVQDGESK